MSHRAFLYLAGDSFPHDLHIETALRQRLERKGHLFLGETDIVGAELKQGFGRRVHLDKAVARVARETSGIVVMGRSSGARIVTMLAAEGGLAGCHAAVVAIGYPFRNPERPDEPDRYAHLPRLAVPTLIIQGARDNYGGATMAERFRRAPIVEVSVFDADHDMRLSETDWDRVTDQIIAMPRLR